MSLARDDAIVYRVAKPCSVIACGLAAPLSVNVRVPVRVVPLAEVTLVNRTVTVQDAPGAMTAPVQLSGPAKAPTLKK